MYYLMIKMATPVLSDGIRLLYILDQDVSIMLDAYADNILIFAMELMMTPPILE